jgi:hypothetical protein
VYESRVLRRIIGLWRKSHNEFHNLSSPNIVRIKSRMRGVGHVTRENQKCTKFLSKDMIRRALLAYLRIGKQLCDVWTGLI